MFVQQLLVAIVYQSDMEVQMINKNTQNIPQVRKPGYNIHQCPKIGFREIHKSYGLWIISSRRRQSPNPLWLPKLRYFEFYAISHLVEGRAFYWEKDGGPKAQYDPDDGVIMIPNHLHYYGRDKTEFFEDTIRFTGPVADQLCRTGILKPGIIHIGHYRRLLPIMELADDPADSSQIKANIALQNLLVELYFENLDLNRKNHSTKISELHKIIQSEPAKWWSLSELADICRLSVNQFRNVFKRETGMNPKTYIDRIKMSKAAEQLCSSERSIAEIAHVFGYEDPYHFSRRFKEIMGAAPEHYRRGNAV